MNGTKNDLIGTDEMKVSPMCQAALTYARRGWRVIPLEGKKPFLSNWPEIATTDEETIMQWWQQYPDANVGIATGRGCDVIDVDGDEGLATLAKLEAEHGPLPLGRRVRTGSGGLHIYVKSIPGARNGVGIRPGIDYRARGGQVVAPPSIHPTTGKPYELIELGLPIDPPAWLVELVVPRLREPRVVEYIDTNDPQGQRYGQRALEEECAKVAHSNEAGGWNDQVNRSSFALMQLVKGGVLKHEVVVDAIIEAAAPWNDHELATVEDILRRAYEDAEPRGVPKRDPYDLIGKPTSCEPRPEGIEQPTTGNADDELTGEELPMLPESLWNERPVLAQIRQAALSRQRSPDAVFHGVLARLAMAVPHTIVLPAPVGTVKPLCYFALLIGPPAAGKSDANRIAQDLLPSEGGYINGVRVADDLPPGSGEGLAEVLFEYVKRTGADGKEHNVKEQTLHNAYVFVDEIDTLMAIAGRSGSTALSTLRTIWTGGTFGQNNASADRKRVVPNGTYTYGVVIGAQNIRTQVLIEDKAGGTPQRFGWASATSRMFPDVLPSWPGSIEWRPPAVDPEREDIFSSRREMSVTQAITDEIRSADRARQLTQTMSEGTMSSHAVLLRLKIADLLAILDSRMNITDDDWRLAGVGVDTSMRVADKCERIITAQAHRAEQFTAKKLANRKVVEQQQVEGWRITECAKRIGAKVEATPGITVAALRRELRRWRDVFTDALEHAKTNGWVNEQEEPGQGGDKRALYPRNEKTALAA